MRVKRASGLALSEAGENYIKALFELSSEDQRVTTTALAEHLGVAPASVTGMLKKLAAERPSLVEYRPRRGASLSPLGRRVAAEVIRHHRLIELYLHQALGFSADEVHDEAERLEHVISEAFEDRVAALLGDPEYDPHGAPIPRKDGSIPAQLGQPAAQLEARRAGRVVRVPDRDPALLRRLTELGIVPGAGFRRHGGGEAGWMRVEILREQEWIRHELRESDLALVRVEPDGGQADPASPHAPTTG
ncbi:MAG: metal-dependent transcriptional regulator [Chloroflexi bacterium]|nr:metal-dependent transcriptional regulator [Chloroflexota bacterium]